MKLVIKTADNGFILTQLDYKFFKDSDSPPFKPLVIERNEGDMDDSDTLRRLCYNILDLLGETEYYVAVKSREKVKYRGECIGDCKCSDSDSEIDDVLNEKKEFFDSSGNL